MNNGMGENKDYEKLMLAAVVHDIGKFWQGTGEGRLYPSINISAANELLDFDLLRMTFRGKGR